MRDSDLSAVEAIGKVEEDARKVRAKLANLLRQIDRDLMPHIAGLQAIASAQTLHEPGRNEQADPTRANGNCELNLDERIKQFKKSKSHSSTVEKGIFYAKLCEEGWSKKQIADSTGYKERYILMLIEHSNLPTEIQEMIANKLISPTCAYETWQRTDYVSDVTIRVLDYALMDARRMGKNKITTRFVDIVLES